MYQDSWVCYEKVNGNLLGRQNDYCTCTDKRLNYTIFHDEDGFCDMLCFLQYFDFVLPCLLVKPGDVHLTTNTTNKVCAGIIINFTCIAEANPAVHTYLLYENDTVIYNMALGTVIKTMENVGQFAFRCEANNSVQNTGRSRDTIFTVLGELA